MLCEISYSDPGAVPGVSTILWGRNRIDGNSKTKTLSGIVPPLSGYFINANDNRLALAA